MQNERDTAAQVRPRRGRTLAVAIGIVVVAGAGALVGHETWQAPQVSTDALSPSPSPSGGSTTPGSVPSTDPGGFLAPGGASGDTGSGQGLPGGGSGGSGSGASGGPSDAASIATAVDVGLVDVNTTLSTPGEEAAGTGMVLTANGEVLTNNHVIEGATSISVTDVGNGKTYGATVVGYDRTEDIAVLQLNNASGLQTVRLGDSGTLSVGEAVVGIGNAGGSGGTPSYAGGSITALDQSITADDEVDGTSEQLTGLISTDADIEAGDSGGPLVNGSGEVVGMDTAGSSGSGGFQFEAPSSSTTQGFAIPINTAVNAARQIESGTSSSTVHIGATAFLGIELEPEGDGSSNSGYGGYGGGLGFEGGGFGSASPGSAAQGVAIAGVVSGDPAANAGLTEGDTITSLDGQDVTSSAVLSNILASEKPGQSVSLSYLDAGGQQHTVTVTLVAGPPQ